MQRSRLDQVRFFADSGRPMRPPGGAVRAGEGPALGVGQASVSQRGARRTHPVKTARADVININPA